MNCDATNAEQVQEMIKAAGGAASLARALGIPPQTAYSWKYTGRIPLWRRAAVLEVIAKTKAKRAA